jgi:hypothetical protein
MSKLEQMQKATEKANKALEKKLEQLTEQAKKKQGAAGSGNNGSNKPQPGLDEEQ